MPELPEAKREPSLPTVAAGPIGVRYAELRCRTNFSFLEGASHADELVGRALQLGYAALAVTDRNSLAGVVRAHVAAKRAGLKLLVGAELTPTDAPPIVVWALDRAGYGRLARLLTVGRRAAPKGECRLTFADVADHAAGLLAGVPLASWGRLPACRSFGRLEACPTTPAPDGARLAQYREVFADRCYALAELHRGPDDRGLLQHFLKIADEAKVPLAAANDVHYHVPERRPLQDVLTAIRHGCTVAQLGERIFSNAERHLRSLADLRELFAEAPQALERTIEIADRCTFSLDELRYEYPEELCPTDTTPLAYLTRLTWEGARGRYPHGVPDKVRSLIEHELTLIAELRYEPYFLTVWDLVRFAQGRGILCQGRGSAANSAVCFCLGITPVDPERIDVLFERFVSRERNEAPDIDVDFEHERREEVLQYLYAKYGRERAGMTAEVITYQARSAVRDVGKALGFSLEQVDALAKTLDHRHDEDRLLERFGRLRLSARGELASAKPQAAIEMLSDLVQQLVHFPRHLSQHVGGMVITQGPLCELVPIENASMPGRTVVEWDKDDLDALGILKVDCLSLGMLTAIRKCFDLIDGRLRLSARDINVSDTASAKPQATLTLATIPPEDPAVYEMISRADTVGVFQIESRAQMSMLPRLQPRCFYDLVIEVAIVRPGPIQGDMVHPYLRRRRGEEPVEYPDDRIRAVLEKTLGVPIFQEQAMRLAVTAAGFTPGEADQLRRAMGAWRKRGVMEPFRQKLLAGMKANGYNLDFAERVFRQIQGFGEYGFPESHAAAFALLVYVSAWLKRYYPAAFTASLINSQPMGFYAPAQLCADARKHGVEVLPVDVNHSEWDCTLESPHAARVRYSEPRGLLLTHNPQGSEYLTMGLGNLRLGFRMIGGVSRRDIDIVVRARAAGPFRSFEEFVSRTKLRSPALRKLSLADAFGSLGIQRRSALWKTLPDSTPMPLFDSLACGLALGNDSASARPQAAEVWLPAMMPLAEVLADYGSVGLTLREHPISFLRVKLTKHGITAASGLSALTHGQSVIVGGLVLLRQRPSTAKGITFVTLEDETGVVNLIVRQKIWDFYRQAARSAVVMVAQGQLQRDAPSPYPLPQGGEGRVRGVIHVLVKRIEDWSNQFADLDIRSRDFR